MKLLMYGVNKETVMKEDTEKYFLDDNKKKHQMKDIIEFEGVEEIAILSDDFRNEYYLYVDETIFSHGEFLRYLANNTDKSLQEIILETYSKFNEDVLRHLFEISSGYLSEPKGSFLDLRSVEKTLEFAKSINTINEIIYKMFRKAICLSYDLKLDELIKPLNLSEITRYIYILKKHIKNLENKNFLVSGTDFEVYYLTKLLLFAGASTVSIIHVNELETIHQYENIEHRFSVNELAKVFPVTEKSLSYRLSKIDGAIINTAKIDIINEEVLEEVSIIRQTKKKQYILDTNKNNGRTFDSPSLNVKYLDGSAELFYNDSEINDAVDALEIKLSIHVKQFMEFLNEIFVNQEEKILK